MMMLWISCLLIGSISCSPIQQDYGSEAAAPASSYFMPQQAPAFSWRMRRGAGSGFDSSSPLHSVPNPRSGKASQDPTYSSGPGSYSSSPNVYGSTNMAEGVVFSGGYGFRDEGYNPEAGGHGFAPGASQSAGYDVSAGGSYAGGYDGSAYVGSSSYGFVAAPQDEAGSYGSAAGYGDENPEPVFSDVSDLEPVYSFSSRSSYQRGRAMFAQTRYTPGEPAPPLMPAPRPISRTVSTQSSPARTSSSKGGH